MFLLSSFSPLPAGGMMGLALFCSFLLSLTSTAGQLDSSFYILREGLRGGK